MASNGANSSKENSRLFAQFEAAPLAWLYLLFDQGRVSGGVGVLPGADVTLAMSAATFDTIYTGRLDAAQAALSGALAFTGRARQALRAQTILPDLARLYGQGQRGMG